MGAGARALLCPRLGFVVHGAARDTRSGRVAALGRLARGDGGEGHVRLYGAELFPPAPRGGPGGVSALCESPCAGQEMNWGTINRGSRNAERGTRNSRTNLSRRADVAAVPRSDFRVPRLLYRADALLALSTNPTATTVTAPITLCHSHETDGAPKFTTPTAAIPAIRPTNAPVARARGIMARRKTPRMEP